MRRGQLIALEGIDGAGTTTQARLLVDWLVDQRQPAHLTCEPSRGEVGILLRKLLAGDGDRAVMALLFAADRLDHLQREIEPHLAQGTHVVTDRYVYSSLAYQGMDLGLAWTASLNQLAPEPDLTIYLLVEPAIAAQRRAHRGFVAEIFETDPQQEHIASLYQALFGSAPADGSWRLDPTGSDWIQLDPAPARPALSTVDRQPRWAVLDGRLDVDAVHDQIRKVTAKICALP